MAEEDRLARVLDRLENVKTSGAGYSARCPGHDDHVNSLTLAHGDKGGVVIHCHVGCPTDSVLRAVGLTMGDLAGTPYLETSYVYRQPDGTELYSVERWANPKTFRVNPKLPSPSERVLYNLPWVNYARQTHQTIYVVEGEKDVECLREYGLIGTCNVLGAGPGKWLPHYSDFLTDATVVVVADNDEPGIRHARAVYHSVRDKAASASLARPLYGKDVTELLRAGYPITHMEPVPEDAPLASMLASSVQEHRVRWAWDRYFPMGSMSILEGDPGDGKSTLTCDLVARWSTGAPMPDGSRHGGPWHCLMVSIEDDPAATIVPRLKAAGANLDHVVLVTGGSNPDLPYNLGVDLEATERQVRQYNIRIIVLDPLMAFLPDGINGLVDSEVRRTLAPLQQMARRLDIAIVVVRHLTKSATRALTAGSGSIGIVGAARAAFLVKKDPGDETQRVMAPIKCNLTKMPPALGYYVEEDESREVGRIRWTGVKPFNADVLFEGQVIPAESMERTRVATWLENLLDNTFLEWKEIVRQGRQAGFSARTLERVRAEVAKCVINPAIGGIISKGYYWHRLSQWPFDSDTQSVTASAVSPASGLYGEGGETADPPTVSNDEGDDQEASFLARARVCDICGETDGVLPFANPWWCIRCRAHSPLRWRP